MIDRLSKSVTVAHRPALVNYRTPLVDRMNRVIESLQLGRDDASQRDPASGVKFNRHMVLPMNPWKVRAHMSATQSLGGGGEPATICNLDTVDYDTVNGFNTSTHQYTVPVAGWWFIAGKVNINIGVATWNYLSWV